MTNVLLVGLGWVLLCEVFGRSFITYIQGTLNSSFIASRAEHARRIQELERKVQQLEEKVIELSQHETR